MTYTPRKNHPESDSNTPVDRKKQGGASETEQKLRQDLPQPGKPGQQTPGDNGASRQPDTEGQKSEGNRHSALKHKESKNDDSTLNTLRYLPTLLLDAFNSTRSSTSGSSTLADRDRKDNKKDDGNSDKTKDNDKEDKRLDNKEAPSGKLIFIDYATHLHCVNVEKGTVKDRDGQTIAQLDANGLVTFNEKAAKYGFSSGEKLNIKETNGAYFRNNNRHQADISCAKTIDKGQLANSWDTDAVHLNGEFTNEQGQVAFISRNGHLFDRDNNYYGYCTRKDVGRGYEWQLSLPVERPSNNAIGVSVEGQGTDQIPFSRLCPGLTFAFYWLNELIFLFLLATILYLVCEPYPLVYRSIEDYR